MKPWARIAILVAAIAVAGAGGFWLGQHFAHSSSKDSMAKAASADADESGATTESKPVAAVSVITLHKMSLSADLVAYGWAIAPASATQTVSAPYECRIGKIMVASGQTLAAGTPLVELNPSPATALAYEEAQSNAQAAARDLQLVEQRYKQNLATNSDLYTAQNANRLAVGKLKNLAQTGAGAMATLKAETAGVVSKIDVQPGQIALIGAPLIEYTGEKQVQAKVDVEPAELSSLTIGQAVSVSCVEQPDDPPIDGTLSLISNRVEPTSRLVEAIVTLKNNGAGLLLDGAVVARIARSVDDALVVPHEALINSDDGGYTLFTVKDGKAVKHSVKVGLETDQLSEVISDELKEGDAVVTVGNSVLDDGAAVSATPATMPSTAAADALEAPQISGASSRPATPPATSEPSTLPTTTHDGESAISPKSPSFSERGPSTHPTSLTSGQTGERP